MKKNLDLILEYNFSNEEVDSHGHGFFVVC
jgi:hypothetical protein